jgi:hypothetical protein
LKSFLLIVYHKLSVAFYSRKQIVEVPGFDIFQRIRILAEIADTSDLNMPSRQSFDGWSATLITVSSAHFDSG